MDQLKELLARIDSLSIRERGIILLAALCLMYYAWIQLFMQPLSVRERNLGYAIQQRKADEITLNADIQTIIARSRLDPNQESREKVEALHAELAAIENRVRHTTEHLVAPDRMAGVLRTILNQTGGLNLLELRGTGAESLVGDTGKEAKAGSPPKSTGKAEPAKPDVAVHGSVLNSAYRHGLVIKFSGDYMSTLKYIRKLEGLSWGFFWDSLDFEVKEYPDATASITVYTLSLDRNWIGV